jgi:hypothetical protein
MYWWLTVCQQIGNYAFLFGGLFEIGAGLLLWHVLSEVLKTGTQKALKQVVAWIVYLIIIGGTAWFAASTAWAFYKEAIGAWGEAGAGEQSKYALVVILAGSAFLSGLAWKYYLALFMSLKQRWEAILEEIASEENQSLAHTRAIAAAEKKEEEIRQAQERKDILLDTQQQELRRRASEAFIHSLVVNDAVLSTILTHNRPHAEREARNFVTELQVCWRYPASRVGTRLCSFTLYNGARGRVGAGGG